MQDLTNKYLNDFLALEKSYPGPIPYSIELGDAQSEQSLFFCLATHGDEVGSLPAFFNFFEQHNFSKLPIRLVVALGNVEAIRKGKRFVEEDMNRAFGRDLATSIDSKRAQEIAKVIKSSNLFVDIHQTIGPTKQPFYVIRPLDQSIAICRCLELANLAICVDDLKIANTENQTGTAYASLFSIPAFTIELSQKGYSKQAEDLALNTMNKTLEFFIKYPQSQWSEIAHSKNPIELLNIDYTYSFSHADMSLIEGHSNGEFFKKGQILGRDKQDNILAPFDGYMFFPKYPERDEKGLALDPRPSHLFFFAKAMTL